MVELTYTEHPEIQRLAVQALHPDQRLHLEPVWHAEGCTITVLEGVLYGVVEDGEVVLTPGDAISIPAGEAERIWNAGDDVTRVIISSR
jgi:uncharacterized cupin superfamily protein